MNDELTKQKVHSPRKRAGVAADGSGGYTADDEMLNSNALWREFVANANAFIDAFVAGEAEHVIALGGVLHAQVRAFRALERSAAGEIFEHFFALPESAVSMRAFYVGSLFQLLNPRRVYGTVTLPAN